MLIVGLTGGIGSGKTTVANLFEKKGITIIDTDQLARDLTQPNTFALQEISTKFGGSILSPTGSLDRAALRKIIFQDQDAKKWLEELLHPLIRKEMERLITLATSPYIIVVIPLLFETKPNPLINRVLVVDSSTEQQIERTTLRDKISAQEVASILNTQSQRETRIAGADDIIYNDGELKDLIQQVDKLHETYLQLTT